MSRYGEIVNINLIRDKDSGKSKGFCFLCYEDQRSTILAVDNLNGIKILNRAIRVDHVSNYKVPKTGKKTDEETKKLYNEGCAPKIPSITPFIEPIKVKTEDFRETLVDLVDSEIKLPQRLPIDPVKKEKIEEEKEVVLPKEKKEKKHKKSKKKKKSKKSDSELDSDSEQTTGQSKEKKRRRIHEEEKVFGKDKSDEMEDRYFKRKSKPYKSFDQNTHYRSNSPW